MVTADITFGDDTRTIEFYVNPWATGIPSLSAPSVFAARIGRGEKMHRCSTKAYLFSSMEQAQAYVEKDDYDLYVTDVGVLALCKVTTLRNRPARIVGWASNYKGTPEGSKQRYHGRLG